MGIYAKNIIDQAKKWIGKKESDGSFKEIIDTYNSKKPLARGVKVAYTENWCATFVSAVAIKCGATSIMPTECGCERMIELYKKLGSWIENENRTPNPGDIVFYDHQDNGKGDNKGWSDHVGIVESVKDGKITIIEGNYNDKVARRTIEVNAKGLRGYAVPKYDVEPVEAPKVETVKPTKSLEAVAKEVINGKWGNGAVRKSSLEKAGYNYSEVQAKVNEILNGKKSSSSTTSASVSASKPAYETYTIKAGDTLSKICKKFYGVSNHTNIQKIANANNISNPNLIRAGVTIKIPR